MNSDGNILGYPILTSANHNSRKDPHTQYVSNTIENYTISNNNSAGHWIKFADVVSSTTWTSAQLSGGLAYEKILARFRVLFGGFGSVTEYDFNFSIGRLGYTTIYEELLSTAPSGTFFLNVTQTNPLKAELYIKFVVNMPIDIQILRSTPEVTINVGTELTALPTGGLITVYDSNLPAINNYNLAVNTGATLVNNYYRLLHIDGVSTYTLNYVEFNLVFDTATSVKVKLEFNPWNGSVLVRLVSSGDDIDKSKLFVVYTADASHNFTSVDVYYYSTRTYETIYMELLSSADTSSDGRLNCITYYNDSYATINTTNAIYLTHENKIYYGTAIPTSLTWTKGDRVINSNPTVGSPKSWICTVSGTPGTWVSEGNL